MFVRKLKSKNSKIYIQVVDKSSGRYLVVKSFGSTSTKAQEEVLIYKAEAWIRDRTGLYEFDFSNVDSIFEGFIDSISSMKKVGYDL